MSNKTIVNITSFGLNEFTKKMDKLVNKGVKLGIDVNYKEIGTEFRPVNVKERSISLGGSTCFGTVEKMIKFYTFEVTGSTPVIQGFKFVGISEFMGEFNIIKMNPFFEGNVPEKFKTYRECDHCLTKRNRIHTVILQEEATGTFISVGKQCVRDFIGHGDPHLVASFIANFPTYEDIKNSYDEDYFGESGGYTPHIPIVDVIAKTIAVIEKRGSFISKAKASELDVSSTANDVTFQLLYVKKEKHVITTTDDHRKKAVDMIEWFKDVKFDMDSSNSYIYNLSVLFTEPAVAEKYIPFIASVPAMYYRETTAGNTKTKKVSNWVGAIKENIETTVTVNRINTFNGHYGLVAIYNMTDTNGNIIVWKTNNDEIMEEGEVLTIAGTIKDHTVWEAKGIKQTLVLRVKRIS
jgi:hypothetical protein